MVTGCDCMSDGAVTCDPVTGACQCLSGVTGPNCDECMPRWVMIENVGCRGTSVSLSVCLAATAIKQVRK